MFYYDTSLKNTVIIFGLFDYMYFIVM